MRECKRGYLLWTSMLVMVGLLTGCEPTGEQDLPSVAVEDERVEPVEVPHDRAPAELPYNVIGTNEDGSTVVQIEVTEFHAEHRVRAVGDESGELVQDISTVLVPVVQLHTLTVPAGEDILSFINERYEPLEETDYSAEPMEMPPVPPVPEPLWETTSELPPVPVPLDP